MAGKLVVGHEGVGLALGDDALLETGGAGLVDVLRGHVVPELPALLSHQKATSTKCDFAKKLLACVPSMSPIPKHKLFALFTDDGWTCRGSDPRMPP